MKDDIYKRYADQLRWEESMGRRPVTEGDLPLFKQYTCDYDHDGKTWAVTISAKDWADAEARVRKLGNLRLRGEIVWVLKASPATPCWAVRFAVGIRNWWHGGQAR